MSIRTRLWLALGAAVHVCRRSSRARLRSTSLSASSCSRSSASPEFDGRLRQAAFTGHAAYFGLGALHLDDPSGEPRHFALIGMVAGGVGWRCWRACRSAGCVFGCAAPISPSPPSQPRRCKLMLIFLKFRDFAWGAEGTNDSGPRQRAADDAVRDQGLLLLRRARPARARLLITHLIVERSWIGYYPRRHRRG